MVNHSDDIVIASSRSVSSAIYGCRYRRRPRQHAVLPLLSLALAIVTGWAPLAPAPLCLAAAAPAAADPTAGPEATPAPKEVSDAKQLLAAIADPGVLSVRLTANVRVDPAAWPSTLLVRTANFTIEGADWFPILDFAFVESKLQLQPGVTFKFGQVEVRNVRTRSGFELDFFSRSPNATVRYQNTVYYCFSCLPPAVLAAGAANYVTSSLPVVTELNVSWARSQAPLAEAYPPDKVVLFRSASSVLAPSGVPGATSGGAYEVQAVDTLFVCQSPIDLSVCERGVDYCVSSKIEELAAKDTTWARLADWAAEREHGGRAVGGGGRGGTEGTSAGGGGGGGDRGVPVGTAVGGAVAGAVLITTVAAVLYCTRWRRRRRHKLAGASDGATSAPAGDSMAVKIAMAGIGDGRQGGGGGGAKGPDGGVAPQRPLDLLSSGLDLLSEATPQPQYDAALAVSTAAAAAPPPPPPYRCSQKSPGGVDGGSTAAANTDESPLGGPLVSATGTAMSMELMVVAGGGGGSGGGAMTGRTLGESYRRLSNSGGCQSAALVPQAAIGMPAARSAKPSAEEQGQPVVVVAGITIELMNSIGTGSFGKVFKGVWQGRPVAVKVLQYGGELCKAVHNEVLLSQTLRHPNVVAALYFAQVLPGGRLGLHTGGTTLPPAGPGGPAAVTPGAVGEQEGGGGGGGGPMGVAAASYSRFITSGMAPSPGSVGCGGSAVALAAARSSPLDMCTSRSGGGGGSGGDGGRRGGGAGRTQAGIQQGFPAPLSSQEACGDGAAPTAAVRDGGQATVVPAVGAAAEALRRRSRRSASTSLPRSAPGPEGIHWLKGSQSSSAPLSLVRPLDLCAGAAAEELAGRGSYGTVTSDDDAAGSGGDARHDSQPDVLSRWDEQRRRQELVERVGARLIGPELVVTSKGFLLQAGGGGGGDTKTPPALPAAAALAAAAPVSSHAPAPPSSSSGGGGTRKSSGQCGGGGGAAAAAAPAGDSAARLCFARPSNTATGPSTPADAAAAALPLEALWLAAHAQPEKGSSHGFLVMELCEGGSAFAWRSTHWKGPEDRPDLSVLLRLALDIAYGMSYIHSMGICHGDLKLSNVLLSRSSDAAGPTPVAVGVGLGPNDLLAGWVAKVCDFGLSRVLTGDRTHVSTRPYGTPTHMAPELWTKGHMSQPADVYAFGMTLWELATGERPYKSLNAARILHRVLLNGGRPALPLWLPPSYTRLVTSCWAQSPKDRPTFAEIVRHLEAMLAVLAAVTPR